MVLQNTSSYDVIIVGAGVIGSTFALKLAKLSDFNICVVEHSEQQINHDRLANQRVFALGKVALDLLDDIGALTSLDVKSRYSYERMFVWDDNSDGELEFKASDYQQESLGEMVDAVSLTIALQAELNKHPQVDVVYNKQIESLSLTESSALIEVTDHVEVNPIEQKALQISAPLIVAADGINSWSRRQAKIFANHYSYHQQGIVALIETELLHEDTAWQVFLPTGPLALLPLSANQSSIVWSVDNQLSEKLNKLSDQEFANEIKIALDGKLGDVKLLSQRQCFPLRSLQAQTYFKHRFALLGDAAHSIHPLAGQGANIGFKDVLSLANNLAMTSVDKLGDSAVLSRYESERKPDNEQTNRLMSFLQRAYQKESGVWPVLRGIGMNTVSRSTSIKTLLAKQAMGLL